jgi:hypothetical protein
MKPDVLGLFFIAVGAFALCGAGFDWDWFMNHRKARAITRILTRTGARVFYALIGAGLVTLGTLAMLGFDLRPDCAAPHGCCPARGRF